MRDLDDIKRRWNVMQSHDGSLTQLQNAVKYNDISSPCVTGLRSVCWKIFMLSDRKSQPDWTAILRQGREEYAALQERFLKYIKHPEALAEVDVDPLTDDPDSPWHTIRQDELVRAEIRQDVQRLPDEANYHDDRIQDMITDILFIYCRVNPNRGGYRQGMHELLAPFVYSLESDAIDRSAVSSDVHGLDERLLELTDASFVEHDAFILFAALMDYAQIFYAINDEDSSSSSQGQARWQAQGQSASIVERSKFIHQVCLQKVDPELASHLTNMEVLPQIFLIRWVRLLFSREFPFESFLLLWDTIFAVDPTLELVDLICVAMLLRIRWQLLEGDYSVCLQLLLKYPPPEKPHGPHTFVSDAVYLRGHLNASGGATLIMKYTGKLPAVSSSASSANLRSPGSSRPATPSFRSFHAFRQRAVDARRSSLMISPSFMNSQQAAGVEAMLQNAARGARGVIEKGEKLGINQAVRDAVGEIRRNVVQGLNESLQTPRGSRETTTLMHEADTADHAAMTVLAALELRNQHLASMLEETVTSLKELSASHLDDKAKSLELIEIAAAKVQFVKIYLEDASMEVPVPATSPSHDSHMHIDHEALNDALQDSPMATADPTSSSQAVPQMSSLSLTDDVPPAGEEHDGDKDKDADKEEDKGNEVEKSKTSQAQESTNGGTPPPVPASNPLSSDEPSQRPKAIPTRSTLAQSSFSWMLEPTDVSSTNSRTMSKSPPVIGHRKGASSSASREKNAFLFGEITSGTEMLDGVASDDIFGMEPMRKAPPKT